jgi:2-polyprenyl-3-methyl-5-hydroxy-6-metoxy-1,4-benzoquinol methylase
VPGNDLLNEIYEEWIPPGEKDRLHRSRDLNYYRYLAEQLQFVVQHLKKNPSAIRALDFGMGWAEWATMAKAFGCQISGSELSAHRVEHAQSIGIEIVQWEDLARRKFDFINTEQVFEHLIDPLPTLRHLANAIDGGGLIRISVPDSRAALRALAKRNFAALSSKQVMPIAPLEHVNCFEYRSLVALGKLAGLRPVRPSLRHLYNSSSGWFSFRNALRLTLRPIYRHVFPKSTVVYFCRR